MARGRMIAKSLSTSRKYAALYETAGPLAEFCQVLYPLLIVHADDFGRLPGDAWTIRHQILPISPRDVSDFEQALACLTDVGLIRRSPVIGPRPQVLQVTGFDRHQSGLHKRTRSRLPRVDIPGKSGKCRDIPLEEKRTELKRTEEKRREEKGRAARSGCPQKETVLPTAKYAYDGRRLQVQRWMHEDLARHLGGQPFDLLAWYGQVDAELEASGESPGPEPIRYLRERLYRDAQLRRPKLTETAHDRFADAARAVGAAGKAKA